MTEEMTETQIAFEAARRLAAAYYHDWGGRIGAAQVAGLVSEAEQVSGPGAPMAAVRAIADTVLSGEPSGLGWGVIAPFLRVEGRTWALAHTTGTGRTTWVIRPTTERGRPAARVEVTIARPAGVCLEALALLFGDGHVEVLSVEEGPCPWDGERAEALPRHMQALAEVIEGLLTPDGWEWSEEAAADRYEAAVALLRDALPFQGPTAPPEPLHALHSAWVAWRAELSQEAQAS